MRINNKIGAIFAGSADGSVRTFIPSTLGNYPALMGAFSLILMHKFASVPIT